MDRTNLVRDWEAPSGLVNADDEEMVHIFGNTTGARIVGRILTGPALRTQLEAAPPWPETWPLFVNRYHNKDPQESASDESGTRENSGYGTASMREASPTEDEPKDIGAGPLSNSFFYSHL